MNKPERKNLVSIFFQSLETYSLFYLLIYFARVDLFHFSCIKKIEEILKIMSVDHSKKTDECSGRNLVIKKPLKKKLLFLKKKEEKTTRIWFKNISYVKYAKLEYLPNHSPMDMIWHNVI